MLLTAPTLAQTLYAGAKGANDVWTTLPVFFEVCGSEINPVTKVDPGTLILTVADLELDYADTIIDVSTLFEPMTSNCKIQAYSLVASDGVSTALSSALATKVSLSGT